MPDPKLFLGQTWDLFGNATGPQLLSYRDNLVGTLCRAGNKRRGALRLPHALRPFGGRRRERGAANVAPQTKACGGVLGAMDAF